MLTLQCLCCSHRNPAGSSYCNACGTPLHLKPCTHCDAINERAALHCRQCGEAFAFDFVAADADEMGEEVGAVSVAVEQGREDVQRSGRPAGRIAGLSRASVLMAGLIAAAGLSAYYAYRDPSAPRPVVHGAEPVHVEVATVAVVPAGAMPVVRPASLAAASAPEVARPDASKPASAAELVETPGPAKPAATPTSRAKRASAGPRSARAAPTRAPSDPVIADAAPAPVQFALQEVGATRRAPAAPRAPAVSVPAAPPPARVTREPPGPCAEGVLLSAACDIRTLEKGN